MMNSLLSVLLLTGALAGFSKRKESVVEGAVAGMPDGEVRLLNQAGEVASATMEQGEFRLTFDAGFPNDYYLIFENGQRVPFVQEKDYTHLEIDFSAKRPMVIVSHRTSGVLIPSVVEHI